MHFLMIIVALTVAYCLRSQWTLISGNWSQRWQYTIFFFLFPPLIILTTAIALLCMGSQGQMGYWHTSRFGYLFALASLCAALFLFIFLLLQGWKSIQAACRNPQVNIGGQKVRLLGIDSLFAGQIGFWKPQLVVSKGLIDSFSPEHLETVLAHEEGHYHYRDTFWFFCLGWVRSCTCWLPNTKALWEELLVLRELRADAYAALRVDPLLLAESLLMVVSNCNLSSEKSCCAALADAAEGDRLEQRIDALLSQPSVILENNISWNPFAFAFLPLVTVLFHT
jgi:Zn-dependent protease with chaperone function